MVQGGEHQVEAAVGIAAIARRVHVVINGVLRVRAEYRARPRPLAKFGPLGAAHDAAAVLVAAQIGHVLTGGRVVRGDVVAVESGAAHVQKRLLQEGPLLAIGRHRAFEQADEIQCLGPLLGRVPSFCHGAANGPLALPRHRGHRYALVIGNSIARHGFVPSLWRGRRIHKRGLQPKVAEGKEQVVGRAAAVLLQVQGRALPTKAVRALGVRNKRRIARAARDVPQLEYAAIAEHNLRR